MLGLLADYGLSGRVCRMYETTDEDLLQLALLEITARQIMDEKNPTERDHG